MTMPEDRDNPKDLGRAIAAAREAMPAYTGLLAFYARVFEQQAAGARMIHVEAPQLGAARLDIARREGLPLVAPHELPVDLAHGAGLLERLCRAVQGATEPLAAAAAAIQAALQARRLDPRDLLRARREQDPGRFEGLAADLGTPPDILAFFADQSLLPSLVAGRRQIAGRWLKENETRSDGSCPVCGSAPALGLLEEDGRRLLFCGMCRQPWPLPRVRCAACGQTNPAKLYYIYCEEEPAYRLDACDACGRYVKTVDRRRLSRPFYPPLEQVLTLHLDLVAAGKGLFPAYSP